MVEPLIQKKLILILLFTLLLAGCDGLPHGNDVLVTVIDSGNQTQIKGASGLTVKHFLEESNFTLNPLDRTDPPTTSIVNENITIVITRVIEEFDIQQAIIPFEQQTVKNESLPEGQSVLIQAGSNGVQENTYRILYENGKETSRSFVSSEIIQSSKPEIVMIGVLSPFTPQTIPGAIAYITSSNAWIMDGNTGNRRPVVSTGDLDGRIFSISPDREWLLFSRSTQQDGEINSLWLANLSADKPEPIKTGISNVVNYADWIPGRSHAFSYSTVEPVPTAPGWNANNDLLIYKFDNDGNELENKLIVDKNSGGISGWWGTVYEWSTNGSKLAYARPDSIGTVDLESGELTSLINFEPYATDGDWAWIPGIKWSPDDRTIFTVQIPNSINGVMQNPALSTLLLPDGQLITLVNNCGLFCYPVPSPIETDGSYRVAYLSSIISDQSETSSYNLRIMDQDGSNQRKLFPDEGVQGLSPQSIKWSPEWASDNLIAVVSQENLILINTSIGALKKITGDGSVSKIDWK